MAATEQWLPVRQGGLADVIEDPGSMIRAHRLAVGWTQVDAAAAAGISQQHLSQIEDGRCLVTFDLRRKFALLCEALGHEIAAACMRDGTVRGTDLQDELMAALQDRWEESLRERAAIVPHSPVPMLDGLLSSYRQATLPPTTGASRS
jgi:transcriptional regulator with XRE-family HTH domain